MRYLCLFYRKTGRREGMGRGQRRRSRRRRRRRRRRKRSYAHPPGVKRTTLFAHIHNVFYTFPTGMKCDYCERIVR
jgi:hypothetical protein